MKSASARTVLLLQGPPTLYFNALQDALERRGQRCLRINFSAGDWLRSRGRAAINYRGRLEHWDDFLETLVSAQRVTDIIYYADRFPYHRVARDVATRLGIDAHTVEFGYLRPNWLTLERGGMGTYSHLPADAETIREIAGRLPPTMPDLEPRYNHSFAAEAYYDVTYNLASLLLRGLYPHLSTDRTYHPVREYLAWLPQLAARRRKRAQTARAVERLRAERRPYYLFPLQLQSDYQIRANSPYQHIAEAIEEVVGSFARNAPADCTLLVKVHPLDNGIERWPHVVRQTAIRHNVDKRVELISLGAIDAILDGCRGTVMINSTVGLAALKKSTPIKVLGIAVYDIPGLTFQGPLDAFWTGAAAPDPALRDDFFRVLTQVAQVKGSFYHAQGREVAAAAMAERIVAGAVNGFGAFVDPPPRLERARALGIAVDETGGAFARRAGGRLRGTRGTSTASGPDPEPAELPAQVRAAV